jgi:hypothetical protein
MITIGLLLLQALNALVYAQAQGPTSGSGEATD